MIDNPVHAAWRLTKHGMPVQEAAARFAVTVEDIQDYCDGYCEHKNRVDYGEIPGGWLCLACDYVHEPDKPEGDVI